MTKGIDTTVSAITVAQLADYAFICRYILNAPNGQNKQITKAEVARFSAGGKRIVSNFEWGEQPPDTVAEGKAHARAALDWASDFHVPDWSPIYFSQDANNPAGKYVNYFHGVCDIITPERSAMYGNGACYRHLLSLGLISYAWHSKSSSYAGNHDTTGANLVQQLATANVGGHQVDVNIAKTALYGGWLLGEPDPDTPKEDDVELTDKLSNGQTVDQALASIKTMPGTTADAVWHGPQFSPKNAAGDYTVSGSARMDSLDAMQADYAAAGAGGTPPSGTVALTDADKADIAQRVADLLAARLQA